MIFHRNSNRNTSTKNQHAEGNCIKKRAKINDFSCEFKQNRTLMNFRRNSSRNWTTKNRHAEGNCIKKHTQIDVFFCRNSFRNETTKKSTRRRELHQKARRNRWFFVEIRAEIETRKIATPGVISSKYEYEIRIQIDGEITRKSRENERNIVKNLAKFEAWKFVTPKASAPKPSSKHEK